MADDRAEIRQAGLRATASRMEVLGLVRNAEAPLTHAEVVEALAERPWDRVTVYRNLNDLAEAGLLKRISLSDGYRFEYAGSHDDHASAHFVCRECDTVICLPPSSYKPPKSRSLPRAVRSGEVEIQLLGLCDHCRV